ncbi:nitroreductase family deazaflavin-dependent oxidoreductase [uncultured Georgenia sp.]|uniref:nitroreductase family deazaflavin-dependent oxidoreductase n=1 Tax=uncultured Georgenia sp. TaxID=378209 RepID=UPI0026371C34|nr:nitroreductase family deazaflavin-dependent oxidoreductase [uncultured Georgenia sp.]HLV03046.1 nitroreductase family deazaflavin-dependent oxidoreductase [Actinomycetaceae bacterium]
MVLPRSVARLNRRFLNRVVIRLAPFLPGLGVFHHRGRRTGRRYAIPINVFPRGDRYVFALTYGPGTDWLRNVQAAGRCTLLTRGTVVPLHRPRVYRDERMSDMPLPARVVLRRVKAYDFLEMWVARPDGDDASPPPGRRRHAGRTGWRRMVRRFAGGTRRKSLR